MRRELSLWTWLAAGQLVLAGCVSGGQPLQTQITAVEGELHRLRGQSAIACAPRQLAIAESQLKFARIESKQGFPSKARQHLRNSNRHAKAADFLVQEQACLGKPSPAL